MQRSGKSGQGQLSGRFETKYYLSFLKHNNIFCITLCNIEHVGLDKWQEN